MAHIKKPVSKLIFTREHILVSKGGPVRLPAADGPVPKTLLPADAPADSTIELLNTDGTACRAELYLTEVPPPEGFEFTHLRAYAHAAGTGEFFLASKAYQLLYWDATHRYCGQCGEALQAMLPEHSKICPSCGLQIFPQIAPAIIIAVLRDGKLLLGHNARFPEGLYSLIAGFVEPGETIEECARREVYEETGVQVGKISYFGSQPWPFPHSLMIGLTGAFEAGTITPDGEEITDARWFTPDTLPNLPGPGSISRKIIDWYIEHYGRRRDGET
jgi:NAD+ diphosphatase